MICVGDPPDGGDALFMICVGDPPDGGGAAIGAAACGEDFGPLTTVVPCRGDTVSLGSLSGPSVGDELEPLLLTCASSWAN